MIEITWYSGDLVVTDKSKSPESASLLEDRLFYIHKSLEAPDEDKPWKKEVIRTEVSLVRPLMGQPFRTFVCAHGLIDRICNICKEFGLEYVVYDKREPMPNPSLKDWMGFWHTQRSTLLKFLHHNRSGILKAPTRYGKCFAAGTRIIMFDGSVKNVEEIEDGEQVLSPDGTARTVVGCVSGLGRLYNVIITNPTRIFQCNGPHILHLVHYSTGAVVNMSVHEWMDQTPTFRNKHKMKRMHIDWTKPKETLDPKKFRLTKFRVETADYGDYYGFELEGADKLFMLADGTVVHNTSLIVNTLRAYPGLQTVITAPGVDLLGQLVQELKEALPRRQINGIFSGAPRKTKFQSDDITVCSLDSLELIKPELVRLLLIDEPHALAAPSRILHLSKFKHARIYGYGATVTGRFDGADALIEGAVGPVLFEKTFQEAVAEGAICPIRVYMMRIPFEPFPCCERNMAYRRLVYGNHQFNLIIKAITDRIPADWQTLIFGDQKKQIDLINLVVENGTTAMATDMTKKERDEKLRAMKADEIKRCIASNIYSTGVTFSKLRCVINAAGGGGSITGTQKPGRLAQRQPGKKRGYMIDFLFQVNKPKTNAGGGLLGGLKAPIEDRDRKQKDEEWRAVEIDCLNRLEVYQKNGYEIRYVNSVEEMEFE